MRHEGYLLVDNRLSGGELLETSIFTCSHCQRQIMNNPNPFRTQERHYCPRCNRSLCNNCSMTYHLTKVCEPMKKKLDEAQERAFRQLNFGEI